MTNITKMKHILLDLTKSNNMDIFIKITNQYAFIIELFAEESFQNKICFNICLFPNRKKYNDA